MVESNYSDAAIAQSQGKGPSEIQVATGRYDFAVDGGAQGTLGLNGQTVIPSGAVIVGGYVHILTALTSGGAATIACQVNAANDILTAVAVATWDLTPVLKNVLPAETTGALTDSTKVLTTAARDISIVIATADLTAGKFDVVLFYYLP
jgi:hypothetical protein